jgi:hypothetical protein
MKEHDGYNPIEMPRRESNHATGRCGPTSATRAIDTSTDLHPVSRARKGERVGLWIDVIKADKRKEWERLLHDVLGPAVARCEPDVLRQLRLLRPRGANPDGTWTYAIVPDPYRDDAEYEARVCVEEALGRERAEAFDRAWDECHAEPQRTFDLVETAW